MNTKSQHWNAQTLVNRTKSNFQIALEYKTLVTFIFDNYKERAETIQNPILHLISHCLELIYKDTISQANNLNLIKIDKKSFNHSHNIPELSNMILQILKTLSLMDLHLNSKEKNKIGDVFPKVILRVSEILKTKVTTYRYANNLNRKGDVISTSIPFTQDEESPNILELSTLFSKCWDIIYIINTILETYKNDIQM